MLMALVILLGVGMGWVVRRARVQREAVEMIKAAGGEVVFDYQRPWRRNAEPWGPKWLRRWLGDEYFRDVVEVRLNGKLIDDATVSRLARACPDRRIVAR